MLRYVIAYVATALMFAGMDFVWLSLAAPRLYKPELGDQIIDGVRIVPAVAFYAIYMVGVTVLCVVPALDSGNWSKATLNGAVMGVAAYAAYDLTNQATLRVWSTKVTVADLAWGMVATAVSATLAVLITRWASRALGLAA
jgi:uncharacterized membrane protein